MSFRGSEASRGIFPSSWFYLVLVHYPTWWIPPLRLRCGRNDKWGTFLRIRLLFHEHFTPPRGPHQARLGEPASPEGSSCTVSDGIPVHSYVVITGTFPERHIGRSLRFHWRGGSAQPHRLCSKRGGRQVAAPTVTLVGSTVQPHRLYSKRGGRLVAAPTWVYYFPPPAHVCLYPSCPKKNVEIW